MDLKSVINIILRDLKEAGELIDDLKNKPGYPELQIELARSKCRSAEDLIRMLGNVLSDEPQKEERVQEDVIVIEDPQEPEIKSDPEIKTDPEIKSDPEKKSDQIIADKFAHLSSRINEKMGDIRKADGKTRTLPVTDLNRALGINDRFYLIRELFGGKEDLFRQTINSLNTVSTSEEAAGILHEAVRDMADSEPALLLLDLVERKISSK
ncbi:MAG: hypothetical protein KFF49_12215 [Bacteroidales bacterium]|nr:hypothetical protein [Bacteroidales bacterium]